MVLCKTVKVFQFDLFGLVFQNLLELSLNCQKRILKQSLNYHDPEFQTHAPLIHELVFDNYSVVDANKISERLFGRVNTQDISHEWFIRSISQPNRFFVFTRTSILLAFSIKF